MTPGDRVEFTQWGGEPPLIGTVKRTGPYGWLKVSALGIDNGSMWLAASIRSPRGRRRGSARSRLSGRRDDHHMAQSRRVALADRRAFSRQRGWVAPFCRARRPSARSIRDLGQVNDESGEIQKGLEEGDVVVVNPGSSLSGTNASARGDQMRRARSKRCESRWRRCKRPTPVPWCHHSKCTILIAERLSTVGVRADSRRGLVLSVVGKKAVDYRPRQPRRPHRPGIETAPARCDFGQHFLAASDDGLIKCARSMHLLQKNRGDHLIIQKGGLAIGDLVLNRDP